MKGVVAMGGSAVESAVDTLDDVLSVDFIQEIMNYVEDNPVLRRFADASCTYLIGHSRVCSDSDMNFNTSCHYKMILSEHG